VATARDGVPVSCSSSVVAHGLDSRDTGPYLKNRLRKRLASRRAQFDATLPAAAKSSWCPRFAASNSPARFQLRRALAQITGSASDLRAEVCKFETALEQLRQVIALERSRTIDLPALRARRDFN
jgi:hypothetical protein